MLTTPEIKAELIDLDFEVLCAAARRLPRHELWKLEWDIADVLGLHHAVSITAGDVLDTLTDVMEDEEKPDITWEDCNEACREATQYDFTYAYQALQDDACDLARKNAEKRREATP